MIKFKRAVLHNFLSYHDAELNLDNQGVTLIEGVNNSNDAYTSSGSGLVYCQQLHMHFMVEL